MAGAPENSNISTLNSPSHVQEKLTSNPHALNTVKGLFTSRHILIHKLVWKSQLIQDLQRTALIFNCL